MASSESTTGMFEILDATEDNLIAVRVGNGSPAGYKEFYSLLIERTNQYGSVVVYEEVPDWTLGTYLTHLHGIMPDIQYGPDFDISHYACVGDSRWTKLLYHQWRAIKPVWPVAPDTMRYYHLTDRDNALRWVTDVAGHT